MRGDFDLFDVTTDRQRRAVDLLERIEREHPGLAVWLRGGRQGPQPLCDARGVELLEEARDLYR